jgi:anti-sigma28 factor (negative regulator of flagellin synthesis)
MKSSFKVRWGHDRDKQQKKSRWSRIVDRRTSALAYLEQQLKTGRKDSVELTEKEVKRIRKEIENIKRKL